MAYSVWQVRLTARGGSGRRSDLSHAIITSRWSPAGDRGCRLDGNLFDGKFVEDCRSLCLHSEHQR